MNARGQAILEQLRSVEAERQRRARVAGLQARVEAVKHFQHERFMRSYSDLLADPRYAKAAQFFLQELYGPFDFSRRDAQFVRVVPALVRLFSDDVVRTVQSLVELHALSESLDTGMAVALTSAVVDDAAYAAAWRQLGRAADREKQIGLMRQVGESLDAYTRNPLLRHSLRMMRVPARLAGLGELQAFLERGFETFREMRGAGEFLDAIVVRERAFVRSMFDGTGEGATAAAAPVSPV
jgi:hypothetical protein